MTTRSRLVTRIALPALLVALALGAAACSDDEPDAQPTATVTVTATPDEEPTSDPTSDAPTEDPEPTESTGPGDAGPAVYDDAVARFDAKGQEPQDLVRFETEAGTYCLLDSDLEVGCELPSGGIPDPDYCGSDGAAQNIGRIVFDLEEHSGPNPVCNSDTIREPDAPVVELDTAVASSATGIQCLVEDIGVTCIDPAHTQGFFLGPDSYTVFNAG